MQREDQTMETENPQEKIDYLQDLPEEIHVRQRGFDGDSLDKMQRVRGVEPDFEPIVQETR